MKKKFQTMREWILMTYYQIRETFEEVGLKGLIRTRIFWKRLATPVEMDLAGLPVYKFSEGPSYQVVELDQAGLETGKWSFTKPCRRCKVQGNLRRGWRLFILANGSEIIGDIWCITRHLSENSVTHPDLDMLGLQCMEGEAYAFDMYVDPAFRGKNLAVPLQRSLHSTLKKEGLRKVSGYYWDDNRPALWMHRMLGFKELSKRQVSRFFFLHATRSLNPGKNSLKGTEGFHGSATKEKL